MRLSKLKNIWAELKEGTLESEICNGYKVTYGKGKSEELKNHNFFRFDSENDYIGFVELSNNVDKTIEYYKRDLIEMGFEDDLTKEKKLLLDVIEKLDNEIVELENENAKIRMYRGAVNSRECEEITNPLFMIKGLVIINPKNKKFEVTNNTSDKFDTTSKVNEESGFRNLAKELYSKGYRIDEVYYNEYSEFPGFESTELFDSDCHDAFDYLNLEVFNNSKKLNKDSIYVAYKNFYIDYEDDSYHSCVNWFHMFDDFHSGEFLVIELTDKSEVTFERKVIYDAQCYNEIIETLLTKYYF